MHHSFLAKLRLWQTPKVNLPCQTDHGPPFSNQRILVFAIIALLFAVTQAVSRENRLYAEAVAPAQSTAFSCTLITDLPSSECEALVALYNSTQGQQWVNNSNWLNAQQTQICDVWYGISCTNNHVTLVSLSNNRLSGPLPLQLTKLTEVQRLWLDQNQLNGILPAELSNLSQLQEITLWGNQLTGAIPASWGALQNLTWLDLSRNQLTGAIPATLGQLTNLRTLGAQENQLTGAIPATLGNLTRLEQIWLSNNQLSGSIPVELGQLTQLKDLGLSSNQLSGQVPAVIGNLRQLTRLWLAGNQFSGPIPPQLGQLTNLQELLLNVNQFTGSIPPELGNLSQLSETLGLNNNQLSGPIPAELGNLTRLKRLSLRDNQLSGPLPGSLGNLAQLTLLYLYNNPGLTGPLPTSLANLTQLSDFRFQNTNLCEPTVAAIQSWLAGIATLEKSGLSCNTGTVTPPPATVTGAPPTATSTPSPTPTPTPTPTATPDTRCHKFDDYPPPYPVADAQLRVTVEEATVEVHLSWESSGSEGLFAVLNTYIFREDGEVYAYPGTLENPKTLRVEHLPDGTYHVVVVYDNLFGLQQQMQRSSPLLPSVPATFNSPATGAEQTATLSAAAVSHPFFEGTYQLTKPDCFDHKPQTGDPASFWDAYQFTIGEQPVIKSVTAKAPLNNHRYLQGVSATNEIVVDVDWQGRTPGRVELKEKSTGRFLASAVDGSTLFVNMGDLPQEGINTFEFIAYAPNRTTKSKPYEETVYAMRLPAWLTELVNRGIFAFPEYKGNETVYEMSVQLPPPEYKIIVPQFGVTDGRVKTDWNLEGKGRIPLRCSGSLAAELSGGFTVEYLRAEIEGSGSGSLASELQGPAGACEFGPPTFTVGGAIQGTYTFYRKPFPLFIPYVNPPMGVVIETFVNEMGIEGYIGKIGEFYVDGSLTVGMEVNGDVLLASPYLKFSTISVNGGVGVQSGIRSDLEVVEADLWAAGRGGIRFTRHAVNWDASLVEQFDGIELVGEVGAMFRIGMWVNQVTGEWKWVYLGKDSHGRAVLQPLPAMHHRGWQIIPHQQASQAQTFQIEAAAHNAFQAAALRDRDVVSTTQVSLLVRDVYTYPETTLALNPINGQGLLLWVQPDATKAVGQAHELLFSRWNGMSWSNPGKVTDDNLIDLQPQVQWANDGKAVAVWERYQASLTATTPLTNALLQKTEIATAHYDPTTGLWSPVTLLTENLALDMAPTLARNRAGQLIAVWRQNAAGRLQGDAAHPDQISAAFYDQGWQTSSLAVKEIPGLMELAVGYGNNSALVVYSQPLSAANGVTPTVELFSSRWNGSAWSAPTPVTNNSVVDQHSPQLVYNQANEPILVWLAGSQLQLRNLSTGVTAPALALPPTVSGVSGFTLVQDQAGNLATVFTAQNYPYQLYLTYYDEAHKLWSNPTPLADHTSVARDLSAAMDATGRLLLGYALTEVAYITKTVALNGNETIDYTIPVAQQTDLMTLARAFDRNLTLTATDLTVSTIGQQATVTATVHNTGDFALSNVKIRFYATLPGAAPITIGEQTLPTPLIGHSTATFTMTYAVPANTAPVFSAKVDPDNLINERNEADNATATALPTLYLPLITR